MIKLTIWAVRKEGWTHEEFDSYWGKQHAEVIKSVKEFNRHIRRYVQCHDVPSDLPLGASGEFDGIAELWFDDVETMKTAFSEPRYLEIVREDELKFVDLEKCLSFVSEELEVIGS